MSQEAEKQQANAIVISLELANRIGDYLSGKPYREVAGLIDGLQKGSPVAVQENAPEAVEEGPQEESEAKPLKKVKK